MQKIIKLFVVGALVFLVGCFDRYRADEQSAVRTVQILGDSVMDYKGLIPKKLGELARSENAISEGSDYWDLSRSGAKLTEDIGVGNWFEPSRRYSILTQAKEAIKTSNLRTIIIDGGANDVKDDCEPNGNFNTEIIRSNGSRTSNLSDACKDILEGNAGKNIQSIKNKVASILNVLRQGGVDHVVWVGNHYLGTQAVPSVVVDRLNALTKQVCEQQYSDICIFVNTRNNQFISDINPNDGYAQYRWSQLDIDNEIASEQGKAEVERAKGLLGVDNIHMAKAGGDKLGELIWRIAKINNVDMSD